MSSSVNPDSNGVRQVSTASTRGEESLVLDGDRRDHYEPFTSLRLAAWNPLAIGTPANDVLSITRRFMLAEHVRRLFARSSYLAGNFRAGG